MRLIKECDAGEKDFEGQHHCDVQKWSICELLLILTIGSNRHDIVNVVGNGTKFEKRKYYFKQNTEIVMPLVQCEYILRHGVSNALSTDPESYRLFELNFCLAMEFI